MGGRGSSSKINQGSKGEKVYNLKDNRNLDVDSGFVMRNAKFTSAFNLISIIRVSQDHRFDILDNVDNESYGTILYTDGYGSDGVAYEVKWQKTYNPENPQEVYVYEFNELEEGEW